MVRPKQARGGNDEITSHRFHSSSNTGGAIYRKYATPLVTWPLPPPQTGGGAPLVDNTVVQNDQRNKTDLRNDCGDGYWYHSGKCEFGASWMAILTPDEFKKIRVGLGLTQGQLGSIQDRNPLSIRRWEMSADQKSRTKVDPTVAKVMIWMAAEFRPPEWPTPKKSKSWLIFDAL